MATGKYDIEKLHIDIKRKIKEGDAEYKISEWVRERYDISQQSVVFN